MSYFQTYCDLEFLDSFMRKKPGQDVLSFEKTDSQWLHITEFLRKHTNLVVDAPNDDLRSLATQYPLIRALLDRPAGTSIDFQPERTAELTKMDFHTENPHPWRVFLLGCTTASNEELSATLGSFFLDANTIFDIWDQIGKTNHLNITKNPENDHCLRAWTDLQQYRTPLTSLLVCDRYMLKNMKEARENVFTLVANVLPDEANLLPVSVMLVTEKIDERFKLRSIWEELFDFLRQERPELAFELSLVAVRGERSSLRPYHDRHIFANYAFMKSGHSFNYFRNGAIKVSTTLDFHPMVDKRYLATSIEKLHMLHEIVDKTREKYGNDHNVVGSKNHPLLDAARRALEEDPDTAEPTTVH